MCEHDFSYQGLVACDSDRERPGSGARYRHYAHVYFCRKCTEKRYEDVPGDFNTYQPLLAGAVLGSVIDHQKVIGHRWPR